MSDTYSKDGYSVTNTTLPRVHAIQTGMVSVNRAFRTRKGGPGPISKIRMLMETSFTEWLPVRAWLIEHPEGNILIDTGERATIMRPDYFQAAGKFASWLMRRICRFRLEDKDEIGPQLATLGLGPREIRWVILTHLHVDHSDGLHYFPDNEILVNEMEWRRPYGSFPQLFPAWLKPNLFQFKPEQLDGFDRAYRVTTAGDVLIVPTPGHTYNHASVLLRNPSNGNTYLFAGDAMFNQTQLLSGEQAGAHADYALSALTYRAIKTYAHHNPTVLLPTHDLLSDVRLATGEVLTL